MGARSRGKKSKHYHPWHDAEFKCGTCGKEIRTAQGLKDHMRDKHLIAPDLEVDDEPETCGYCGEIASECGPHIISFDDGYL